MQHLSSPRSFLTSFLAACLAAGCAADPSIDGPTYEDDDDVGLGSAEIVNGTPGGDPAVVWIYNSASGGLCSGTLIEPRVVLTAKHCIQESGAENPVNPSSIVVGLGDRSGSGAVFRAQSIYTTPGVWTEGGATGLSGAIVGVDVATIVLRNGVSTVTPIPIRLTPPGDLVGDTFTACGFGQIPSGPAGRKYTVEGRVNSVQDHRGVADALIYVGAVTCQGDSGGPLITEDHEVAGVVSFGTGGCGAGYGAYNAIYPFLESVLQPAIEEGGGCVNDGAEICDGRDNDCNGEVDEICTPIGGSCGGDDECVGNTCRATVYGMRCTAACDIRRPDFGCEEGLFCASNDGCTGYCVPLMGSAALPNGSACTDSGECDSLFCVDPGDGRRRCLTPCRADDGACNAGDACAASLGNCGGCVDEAILAGTRGLGEGCDADGDCYSMMCLSDSIDGMSGRMYCTRSCSGDAECGSGYHCRGDVCVTGPRGFTPDPCIDNGDCAAEHFCATRGSESWCTRFCDGDATCPDGTTCVEAGGARICAPDLTLSGGACMSDDQCISGLCTTPPGASEAICTRECRVGASCPTGLECRGGDDSTDGTAYCAVPSASGSGGGGCCSVAGDRGHRGRTQSAVFGSLLLLGLLARRARRAR